MGTFSLISSDSHVVEPPDVWTDRIDTKFKDRAPVMIYGEGSDWWYIDGQKTNSCQAGTQTGVRFVNPETLKALDKWENVRPGAYIPDEHIKDLDLDGVDGTILYPTEGLFVYRVPDVQLVTAICAAYNDWLAEFCSAYPDRIKGIAMINVDDIPEAVKELHRARKIGLAGAMITVYPTEDKSYDLPDYDPFWAASQDLDMPLSLHSATNRPSEGGVFQDQAAVKPEYFCTMDHWVRMSIARMIFSEVFVRFPKLKVGCIEHELGWIPYYLQQLDYTYSQRAHRLQGWPRFKEGVFPSHFWYHNIFVGFQEDTRGIRERHIIGVDNLLWGNDYPHAESTFPRTREILDRIFEDVPADDRQKIVAGNAARLYHFE